MTVWERALWRICRDLLVGFCRVYWRVTIEGAQHLPPSGGYVLAPVHRSNIDTPVVAAVTRRRLRFMGKDTMWKWPPAGRLFSALGAFPVRRGSADREAMRRCMEVVRAGEPLVVFPEGGRQSGPVVRPLFEGAAYIALRAGVPIIPVGIGGTERAMPKGSKVLRPVKVHVVVGEPLRPEPVAPDGRAPRRAVRELTERLATRLQELFDRAQARSGAA